MLIFDEIASLFIKEKRVDSYNEDLRILSKYLIQKGITDKTCKQFLQGMRTETIIESLDDYIEDSNIRSQARAYKYFSCIKEFFLWLTSEDIIENRSLVQEFGYTTSSHKSYQYKVNKFIDNHPILKKGKTYEPRGFKEIEDLIEYCDRKVLDDEATIRRALDTPKYFNKYRSALIIKLMILTGIKYEVIYSLMADCLDIKHNSIEINSFKIRLPYRLMDQFLRYEEILSKLGTDKKDRKLFVDINGKEISNKVGATHNFLKDATGNGDFNSLIKFTIIEMIKKGINESIIMEFTGVGATMYGECQNAVNSEYKLNQSRYLDSRIRRLEVYDLL